MSYSLQQLSDRFELLELGIRFARYADQEVSTQPCANLFTTDGIFHVNGADNVGQEAIGGLLTQMRQAGFSGPATSNKHLVFNAQVSLVEDHAAEGTSEWLLLTSAEENNDTVSIVASGKYVDTYAKVDGNWAITRREVTS